MCWCRSCRIPGALSIAMQASHPEITRSRRRRQQDTSIRHVASRHSLGRRIGCREVHLAPHRPVSLCIGSLARSAPHIIDATGARRDRAGCIYRPCLPVLGCGRGAGHIGACGVLCSVCIHDFLHDGSWSHCEFDLTGGGDPAAAAMPPENGAAAAERVGVASRCVSDTRPGAGLVPDESRVAPFDCDGFRCFC